MQTKYLMIVATMLGITTGAATADADLNLGDKAQQSFSLFSSKQEKDKKKADKAWYKEYSKKYEIFHRGLKLNASVKKFDAAVRAAQSVPPDCEEVQRVFSEGDNAMLSKSPTEAEWISILGDEKNETNTNWYKYSQLRCAKFLLGRDNCRKNLKSLARDVLRPARNRSDCLKKAQQDDIKKAHMQELKERVEK